MEVTPFDYTRSGKGARVFLRSSLNVPIEDGKVTNTFRLKESLATIEAYATHGARVVVCAHLGRDKNETLRPVWEEMKKHTAVNVLFASDVCGEDAHIKVAALKDGEVLLLENVRRESGEEENDEVFAKTLASLADVYVNDAFADSHRAHASIVGVPKFLPHFAGPNFIKELTHITPARNPESPSLAIVGGAKFETKEPLLRTLLATYDHVFVGGALANDFLKAKGYEVGVSLLSKGTTSAHELLNNSKLLIPHDVVVPEGDSKQVRNVEDLKPTDMIFDVGPQTVEKLAPLIQGAKFILWNGPLGNFEKGFDAGTKGVARLVSESSAISVVGGGDTIAAIEGMHPEPSFGYVSTAGGAMLDFIAHGTIAGIEALTRS